MVKVLDCTIRDGGYYNDWNFSDSFVQKYLEVCSLTGISHVEIGFRFLKNRSHAGAWAYSPDEKIQDFHRPDDLKLGVMINAQEFDSGLIADQVRHLFKPDTTLDFVRVALRFDELEQAREIIPAIKELGLYVGINLMQVSELDLDQIQIFKKVAASSKADFVYAADSLGALNPLQTKAITQLFVSEADMPFGLHAHDNNGLALSNSVSAIESGASMIDSTMGGMGRGAGNTSTEQLLMELMSRKQHELSEHSLGVLNGFLDSHMAPLRAEFGWGSSLAYSLAANWGIHPTFVQELVEEGQNGERIVASLANLKGLNATRFNRELLSVLRERPQLNQSRGFMSEQFLARNKTSVLIVGGGETAKIHSREILRFAQKHNLTTFLLNQALEGHLTHTNSRIFRVAANYSRLEAQGAVFWRSSEEKIVPNSRKDEPPNLQASIIPIKYVENQIDFKEGVAVVPNNLTISYALAVAVGRKPDTVYLAGVDGYGETSIRNSELNRTLGLFRDSHTDVEIFSLTPTGMPIPIKSPYWRGPQ